jgi:uncharacterized protein (DUF427 family)
MAETQQDRIRIEPCHKRVRAYLGGQVVLDTIDSKLVWENPAYPAYYFPEADVRTDLIPADSLQRFDDGPVEELHGLVRIDWRAMDEWLEEDEPVYVHPRSPYARVDCLASSRHVEVKVDGVTVADTHHPVILFETGLPPRYYIPLSDLRTDLLTPTDHETMCPYKGTATYWSLTVNGTTLPNFVWCYRAPLAESQKIAGLACFYNEKVDLVVDGVPQDRPRTHFS